MAGQDAQIDTTTAAGRLVFGIFAALAEVERELIRERTVAGLEAARAGEKVSIGESGRVDGVVSAPRVAVADGAHVQGRVETQARRADRPSATGR